MVKRLGLSVRSHFLTLIVHADFAKAPVHIHLITVLHLFNAHFLRKTFAMLEIVPLLTHDFGVERGTAGTLLIVLFHVY